MVATLVAFMLILCILPVSVSAEDALTMKVNINFNGQLNWEKWNRIQVQLENISGEDFKGTAQLSAGGIYTQDVEIKKGEGAIVEFYLPPLAVEHQRSLNISVKNLNSRTVVERTIELNRFYDGRVSNLNVGISGGKNRFQRIVNLDHNLITVEIKPEHFNNLLFLDNLTLVILDKQFILSSSQKNNLLKWVELGGTLVVEEGSSLYQELSRLDTSENTVIIEKDYGRGNILFSTIQFDDELFEDIVELEAYLNQIIRSNKNTNFGEFYGLGEARRFLNQLSSELTRLKFLTPTILFLGLLTYISLIGPINFIVLKRLKKWDYGWITIPSLAIIFTVTLFFAGNVGRSNVLSNNQVNYIEYYQNGTNVLSYNSILIPRKNVKDLALQKGHFYPLTSGIEVKNNEIIDLRRSRIWSLQRLVASTEKELQGPKISLKLYEKRTEVSIENFEHPMFDSYLYIGDRWYKVGELKSGESKDITLIDPINYTDYEQLFNRYNINWDYSQIIEELSQKGNYVFVGLDDIQANTIIDGVKVNKVLNLNILTENMMEIAIMENSAVRGITGHITRSSFGDYVKHDHRYHYFGGEGELEIAFNLPNLDYTAHTGIVELASIYASTNPKVEVFNVRDKSWETTNFNNKIKIHNLENYSDGGIIRLKLTTVEDSHLEFSTENLKISVEGGAAR